MRERSSGYQVAEMLRSLSDANQQMGLHGEGVKLVKEALEIYKWLGPINLTWLLLVDNQLSVIEEAAYHTITLLPGGGVTF